MGNNQVIGSAAVNASQCSTARYALESRASADKVRAKARQTVLCRSLVESIEGPYRTDDVPVKCGGLSSSLVSRRGVHESTPSLVLEVNAGVIMAKYRVAARFWSIGIVLPK